MKVPTAKCQTCKTIWSINKCFRFEWTDKLFCRACAGICDTDKDDLKEWLESQLEMEKKEDEKKEPIVNDLHPSLTPDKKEHIRDEIDFILDPDDFDWDLREEGD